MVENSPPEDRETIPGSSPLKLTLKISVAFLISAALVVWILYQIENPQAVWASIRSAAVLPLLAIVPVSLASHLLRAWRWRRFIGRPVSLFYSFSSVMIGYAVNDVLPRVGEIARVVNMNRTTRVPIAQLLTTLVAERLLDVIALALLLGLSFMLEGDRIAETFPALAQAGPLVLGIAIAGLAGLAALAFASEPLTRICGRIARGIHGGIGDKAEAVIRQGAEGLAFLKRPSQALPVLLETAGIWVLYLAAFLLGLAAFGHLSEIGYRGGTVVFSVTCAGVLVPTMGAIGSYHELGRISLAKFYEVGPDQALACITVIHAILFYVVGGLFGVLVWGLQVLVRRRADRRGQEP